MYFFTWRVFQKVTVYFIVTTDIKHIKLSLWNLFQQTTIEFEESVIISGNGDSYLPPVGETDKQADKSAG